MSTVSAAIGNPMQAIGLSVSLFVAGRRVEHTIDLKSDGEHTGRDTQGTSTDRHTLNDNNEYKVLIFVFFDRTGLEPVNL